MAGVAVVVRGALLNAFAFSGTNYLFSMFQHRGADEERIRHDKAVEQLQAAHIAWSQRHAELLDWKNEELRRQHHAVETLRGVERSMREYARVHGHLGPEPRLSEFYHPSGEQKDNEIAFIVGAMALTSFMAYRLLL